MEMERDSLFGEGGDPSPRLGGIVARMEITRMRHILMQHFTEHVMKMDATAQRALDEAIAKAMAPEALEAIARDVVAGVIKEHARQRAREMYEEILAPIMQERVRESIAKGSVSDQLDHHLRMALHDVMRRTVVIETERSVRAGAEARAREMVGELEIRVGRRKKSRRR